MQSAVSTAVSSKRGLSLVQKLQREIRTNGAPYLFVAPYALLFFLFTVLPVMIAIGLSFTHYNMLQPPKWIGYQNYLRLFLSDDVFLIAVKNTFVFALITGPLSYFACFIFAWLIQRASTENQSGADAASVCAVDLRVAVHDLDGHVQWRLRRVRKRNATLPGHHRRADSVPA